MIYVHLDRFEIDPGANFDRKRDMGRRNTV